MRIIKTKIPKNLTDYYATNGFHIVINKYYTATVRNLLDFVIYLNTRDRDDIDMDVFGEITNVDQESRSDFKSGIYELIAEVKGFATFSNGGNKHKFIECTDGVETISIKTKNGKQLTICVMEDYGNCIDIKLHEQDKFNIIGFDKGRTPVPNTEVTLTTILL
jgi:hypothetical protein